MKFYNVGVDEDSRAVIYQGDDITKFEYRGYIQKDGLAGIERASDVEANFEAIVVDDFYLQNGEEGQQELEKLKNGFGKLWTLYAKHGGVLIIWAVEYDQNWLLIYDSPVEEITEWFNREVDESEFEF